MLIVLAFEVCTECEYLYKMPPFESAAKENQALMANVQVRKMRKILPSCSNASKSRALLTVPGLPVLLDQR